MKRVMITGASGFIGRHVLRPLADLGYDLHPLSCTASSNAGYTWHRCDLHDPDQTAKVVAAVRPTHLVHLAWYTEHGKYWGSAENVRWVESSLHLMRRFVECGGRRAVVAGTCAEYDWRYGYCSEMITPLVPTTLYGSCKHALHTILAPFAAKAGLSLAWARIFFPYGPHEPPGRLVPSVLQAVLGGKKVQCTHGNQIRDFVYVEDVARALAVLLDSPFEGPMNIASGNPITLKTLVQAVISKVPGDNPAGVDFGALSTPSDDPPLLLADVRLLNHELDWKPRHDLHSGLSLTVQTYLRERAPR